MTPADWQVVAELIVAQTGAKCGALVAHEISGGDINRAFQLSDSRQRYFAKTNSRDRLPMFEAELRGLNEILQSNTIRVPQPIGCGVAGAEAFIVMEYIELAGTASEIIFAQQLAAMHSHTGKQFGFEIDNTIGSNPQPNAFENDWIRLWQQHRLGFQLALAHENGFGDALFETGMELNQRAAKFFQGYSPVPSLLHGDLWSGNYAADSTGQPVIYDPACYYGDHEVDLAMMELFGQPGNKFFSAYNEAFPIDAGYSQRRELYNLYHILNHANLFGGSYANQAQRMINQLLV